MTDPQVAIMMLGIFILTIFLGFPVCFTLMAMGVAFGYYAYYDAERMQTIFDNRIFDLFVNQTYSVMANDVLTAIPLFLFMGYIVERANIVNRLFDTLYVTARNLPGAMAVAALATCALFATATGIIGAVVTLMGLLALPAMMRAKYNTSFASGVICAGGCLGILIPPSIMLIVYAATSNVSIVRLYAGAIFPGFLLAGLYILYVVGRAWLNPSLAPKPPEDEFERLPLGRVLFMLVTSFFPLAFLILSVLGAILLGLATPSEAAAVGAIGGLVLAIAYRIAAIRNGRVTPEWMRDGAPVVNPWIYALGVGGIATTGLFLIYFTLRILASKLFGAPAAEAMLPVGPGISIALAVGIGLLVHYFGDRIEVLRWIQPRSQAMIPVFEYAGRGALMGLLGAVILSVIILIDRQTVFRYQEYNPWAYDAGLLLGLIGWTGWKVIEKQGLRESVYLTVRTSAMVCWMFVGSWVFSSVFSYMGGESLIHEFVVGLNMSPIMFLIMAQFIIFLLGWPLEWSEIIIIFVPIFLPLLPIFGIDPLFFGILIALNLQTSFLTPPMAMAAYYLKGVAPPQVALTDIFRGVMPFLALIVFSMVLLYVFPQIAFFLPDYFYGAR